MGVYTPQIVVAGRKALVGSDGGRLAEAVGESQAAVSDAKIRIESAPSARVKLSVTVEGSRPGDPRVMLALFENGLETKTQRPWPFQRRRRFTPWRVSRVIP